MRGSRLEATRVSCLGGVLVREAEKERGRDSSIDMTAVAMGFAEGERREEVKAHLVWRDVRDKGPRLYALERRRGRERPLLLMLTVVVLIGMECWQK